MIDRDFLRRKLELISEELARLVEFGDISYEELVDDFIKLAAVERILERIVNRAIDVNEHIIARYAPEREEKITRLSYKESFLKLSDVDVYPQDFAEEISRSAGLRNVLVDEYNDIDHRIVFGSIRTCIEQYRDYARYIEAFLTEA